MSEQAVNARREIVKLGETENLWIEGFVLPSQEIRYSLSGISRFLGNENRYVSQVLRRESQNIFKAWRGKGLTGVQIEVKIAERKDGISGASIAKTLSNHDFRAIVIAEADRGNTIAKALLAASFLEVIERRERSAIGLDQLSEADTLKQFSSAFEAYQANYEDWAAIEEQEAFLEWMPKSIADEYGYVPTASGYDTDPDCYHYEN